MAQKVKKKTEKKIFEKVEVAWMDADSSDIWEYLADLEDEVDEEPTLCRTIGFVLKENKDWLWVSHTVTENLYCGRLRIPKKWIKFRKRIGKHGF